MKSAASQRCLCLKDYIAHVAAEDHATVREGQSEALLFPAAGERESGGGV